MGSDYYIQKFIFLSVTGDLELTASQAVKSIFIFILISGALFNLYRLYKAKTTAKRIFTGIFAILLVLISLPVIKWFDIEGNLLNHAEYVTGITNGFCQEFAKGAAIEFEYELDGVKYANCNTYHPVPKDKITVPGGKYYVRVAKKYPEKGRMDFNKPAP